MSLVEPEILGPGSGEPAARVRIQGVKVLGIFGAMLAVLTMFAAFGVGLLVLFGTTLISAALVTLLWPRIFSPEFTQWVFGAPNVQFWKLFLIFLAFGTVLKLFRRRI